MVRSLQKSFCKLWASWPVMQWVCHWFSWSKVLTCVICLLYIIIFHITVYFSLNLYLSITYLSTKIYIYIYRCICIYMCVCLRKRIGLNMVSATWIGGAPELGFWHVRLPMLLRIHKSIYSQPFGKSWSCSIPKNIVVRGHSYGQPHKMIHLWPRRTAGMALTSGEGDPCCGCPHLIEAPHLI